MSIASVLSRRHAVTIVARDMPGDPPSTDWASPWAGASFIFGGCNNRREMQMQLDAFVELWRLSDTCPGSGVKKMSINDVFDEEKGDRDVWWKDHVTEFRWLGKEELPLGAKCGITYKTLVMNPNVFLLWFKSQLESQGVVFKRMHLDALEDVDAIGHDVLVNASGFGSKFLTDIRDEAVELIRGQTIVVRSDYDRYFMRDNGRTYTYAIPRGDGTVVLGGVRHRDSSSTKPDAATTEDVSHDTQNVQA
ncbi:uncharacterized protein N0V89_011781 [Didymosphaeria variabile]|uniref:FAD dependent oxidoreductase domain-containing protein n=1 Tax=Didymosphaeria variabile TaxID=1932322 RepID=A0A9W9C5N3_9PLEO|nr:uncharacterized protein N0V89_011781 [Didymosphaeria variabile]KAJ4345647.1 hypothetical protein N0V89_011781 [Didymosphaeria variabile]